MFSGRAIHSTYSKALLLLILLILAAGTAVAQGKGNEVEVRSLAPAVAETAPGRVLSLRFSVTNKTAQPEELAEVLQVPDGWTPIVPAAAFELPANGNLVRIMAFSVPRGAASGHYNITYSVRSPKDYAVFDTQTVPVNVLSVSGLELLVETCPAQAVAGDTFEISARVLNRGNAPATVELQAPAETKSCQVTLNPAKLDLAAGASAVVRASVHTDPHQTLSQTLQIKLSASLGGPEGKSAATAEATATVEVFSLGSPAVDPYRRLPMVATWRLAGGEGGTTLQAQLSGAGFLDERRTRSVDFSFTSPDTTDTSFLGQREEYWLNYSAPSLDLRLGDNSYGLSYLTEYSRYGRGLDMAYHPQGPWSGKAYYLHSRFEEPALNEEGFALRRDLSANAYLQVNFVSKHVPLAARAAEGDGALLSLSGGRDFAKRQRLDFEIAQSRAPNGTVDQAYQVQLGGVLWPGSYYSFSKQYGGPDFQGYFRDADYVQAGLSTSITRSLGAHVSYSNWQTGLAPQAGDDNAARERLIQAGLSYQLAPGWDLSADLGWFRHRLGASPLSVDTDEQVQRYGLGYSHGKCTARLEMQLARQMDNLLGVETRPRQLNLYASYFASEKLSFTAFGSTGSDGGEGANSFLLGSANNVGLGVNWRRDENLSANLAYSRFGSGPGSQGQDQLTGQIDYRLGDGHEVKLEVRQDSAFIGDPGNRQYMLSYSVPFGLRLGRKSDGGQIEGRVFDATSAAKAGIGKVIVTCSGGGGAIATKADGTFAFSGLPAGDYMVQIKGSSLGAQRVPDMKMPLTVTLKAGATVTQEIGVTVAGSISGQVSIYRGAAGSGTGARENGGEVVVEGDPSASGQPTGDGAPVANVFVELSRDDVVLRAATNSEGEFRFDGLRPGRYHLHVLDDQVPELHYLERPEQDIDVVGGSPASVEIRILPRTRRIKMIDEGAIRVIAHK